MILTLKRIAVPIVLALLAVFVQSSILRVWLPDSFIPVLAVILVVHLGFHEVSLLGAWLAFVTGLVFDSSSGTMLGPWATACVGLYGILSSVSRRVFLDSIVSAIIISAFSAIFALLVYLLLVTQFRPALGFSILALSGGAFATALVAPIGLSLIEWSYKRFGPQG